MTFVKYFLIITALTFLISCSAGRMITSRDIQGTWVTMSNSFNYYNTDMYCQIIFANDSFFTEIGALKDEERHSPFQAKGKFRINGSKGIIDFEGIHKPENSSNYTYPYSEKFDYYFDDNTLLLKSLSNPSYHNFSMIRR